MKYIKIKGNSYNEVMMKLKMEHGDDAIPISHKFVKEGGILNSRFFAKEVVELTAAVQERKFKSGLLNEKKKVDITVGDKNDKAPSSMGKVQDIIDRVASPAAKEKEEDPVLKNSFDSGSRPALNLQAGPGKDNSAAADGKRTENDNEKIDFSVSGDSSERDNRKLERELEEIKRTLYRMTADRGPGPADSAMMSEDDAYIKPFRDILVCNDYDSDQCSTIISEMKNSISRDDLKDKYKIEKSLKDLLKSRIVTTGPLKSGNKKKIVMFIGPTGVGKTTTMAKLGAINSLRSGHSVTFLTIDNYRIAATEQLKKYAEIMNIPIFTVNNQKEFKDKITTDKSEIIMIDTSGRSHRNDLKISEIKSFADLVDYDFEKILCVSANTKKADLIDVFKAFETIHFNSVVITKVDETSYIGNVVDVADKYNKPISYLTNGQEVPNDIIVANPDKIVDMMIGNAKI